MALLSVKREKLAVLDGNRAAWDVVLAIVVVIVMLAVVYDTASNEVFTCATDAVASLVEVVLALLL